MSNLSDLELAIGRTLAYFDVFDYPLTVRELRRWLYPTSGGQVSDVGSRKWAIEDVERALTEEPLRLMIGRQGDFVFLAGRQAIVEVRQQRARENERKWKRAMTTARYLELVPFVKMVAVVNTLAINNARPESDIDVLVVTVPGHLWMARLLVTGIVSMLGYRRHGRKITNRVCLSFYITTDTLNLESLKSIDQPDTHFAFWTAQAVPLLNIDGTYERYVRDNVWVNQLLPNAWQWNWAARVLPPNPGWRSIKKLYEMFFATPIGWWLESWARERQMKKMAKNVTSKSKAPTTDVIISDEVLKFHEEDRRRKYNQAFVEKLRSLGIEPF
ncbi:MAG: hypothetical protein HYY50_04935 [Candidatus Kerfeldbacteria bacterium]|nr:hypothetical protein [Candidatus Kerfeldbacteria bacterium]